jgi:hypothetical protein
MQKISSKNMQDIKKRYMQFAIGNAMSIEQLSKGMVNNAYAGQLIRSSSSPGANYRAALRGKSSADFITVKSIKTARTSYLLLSSCL